MSMSDADQSVIGKSINAIRALSIDAIQNANSGHPGLPLGAAPMMYTLWERHLRHNPSDPDWPDRDRFVLSPGHGSILLYSLLHLTGYDLSLDDLRAFRQWGSRTPGHPEANETPGVEATTGPLGQGVANAVGMAIAERAMAHRFNRPGFDIVDHFTYLLAGDGDLMEGVAYEAISLAGHLKLGRLIMLYDSNDISLDGPLSISFSGENVAKRFEACGWQVLRVEEGDTDVDRIDAALVTAKAEGEKPTLIEVKTTIGFGSPNKGGTSSAHGSPLGEEEVGLTKEALGLDPDKSFHIPDQVADHLRGALGRGEKWHGEWKDLFHNYETAHPEEAAEWARRISGDLPDGWEAGIPVWGADQQVATRVAGGDVLQGIALLLPELMGGDADLSSSTKTRLKEEPSFDGASGEGRNLHFGVREHAMAGICNGMAYHGGFRPYAATFFCFADYMRPSVRLAAMNELPVCYIWTHDSIEVGEDGPTHQPVEHLMAMRAIPGLTLFRPADANETAEAWRQTLLAKGPTALVLSRQNLPVIDRERFAPASGVERGAYVLADPPGGNPEAILIATGSEVAVALEAWEVLSAEGIRLRIVSMPSWELFDCQEDSYRESVLPRSVRARVSVEAGIRMGWEKWVGLDGIPIGIDRYGASAPGGISREKFGLTAPHVAEAVRSLVVHP